MTGSLKLSNSKEYLTSSHATLFFLLIDKNVKMIPTRCSFRKVMPKCYKYRLKTATSQVQKQNRPDLATSHLKVMWNF